MQTIALAKLHLKCDKCHAYTKTLTVSIYMRNIFNCTVYWEDPGNQSERSGPLLLSNALANFGQIIRDRIKEGYELVQE